MAMRYVRKISDEFQKILSGPLAPLIAYRPECEGKDYFLYDFQIRENDELMVYCGTSRVVVCKYNQDRKSLRVYAAPTYQDVTTGLMRTWNCKDDTAMNDLSILLLKHLKNVDKFVPRSMYQNKKEGYWQNRICVDFGRRWEPSDNWLIVDREVVIGFKDTKEKNSVLGPIVKPYEKAVSELRKEDSKRWGQPVKKSFGNELDLLVIDRQGNLLCIELKYGDATAGIYWGMYQTAVYRDLAKKASPDLLVKGAAELVRQKVKLGLLPESARLRLLKLKPQQPNITAVLAVAQPNQRSSCWKNLEKAVSQIPHSETLLAFVDSPKERPETPYKVTVDCFPMKEYESHF